MVFNSTIYKKNEIDENHGVCANRYNLRCEIRYYLVWDIAGLFQGLYGTQAGNVAILYQVVRK